MEASGATDNVSINGQRQFDIAPAGSRISSLAYQAHTVKYPLFSIVNRCPESQRVVQSSR